MINAACMEYIDVHRAFFDVDVNDICKYAGMFDDEDGLRVRMNQVISKPYAIEKAFEVYRCQRNEFTHLYVSTDAVKAGLVCDYFEQRIFENLDKNLSGWLFFFDPVPFANWEHPCSYLFVVDGDNYQEIEYNRGLSEKVPIEKIY